MTPPDDHWLTQLIDAIEDILMLTLFLASIFVLAIIIDKLVGVIAG